jgi:plastocyanin
VTRLRAFRMLMQGVTATLLMVLHVATPLDVVAQDPSTNPTEPLPIVELDATDSLQWNITDVAVAPGQTIRITNRGVLPHTFVVPDWGIRLELPTLEPVDLVIPSFVVPGETYQFLCDEPGHADAGMTGTLTIISEEEARRQAPSGSNDTPSTRAVSLQANDDFTWTPNTLEVQPGQILQVKNAGVIEHHFVVDDWGINETISSGETVLIRIPNDAPIGATFTFYCSVPGHRAQGMEGTITIVASGDPLESPGGPGSTANIQDVDVREFLPDASVLGEGWDQIRTGNVRAIMPAWSTINVSVFPGEGVGSIFVGPSGSRAAVAILPMETTTLPTNQIQQAIDDVQFALTRDWSTNSSTAIDLQGLAPPPGCSIAQRATGVTGLYTLPAGLTICQVRNAEVVIFVTVEGNVDDMQGVEASDQIVERLLGRFGSPTGSGAPDSSPAEVDVDPVWTRAW